MRSLTLPFRMTLAVATCLTSFCSPYSLLFAHDGLQSENNFFQAECTKVYESCRNYCRSTTDELQASTSKQIILSCKQIILSCDRRILIPNSAHSAANLIILAK